MSTKLVKDNAERAAKTFVAGYLGVWLGIGGASFDSLFTVNNLKAGVVALALTVAGNLGLNQIGNKDTASVIK